MDLIDRQAAIDFIDAGRLVNPNEPRWSDNEVVNFLKSRPSAIVQCKTCKHHIFEDEKPGMVYCPEIISGWVKNDCFCSAWEAKQ